jgi:hypothetical protein
MAQPLADAPSILTRSNLSRFVKYAQPERDLGSGSTSDQSEDDNLPSSLSYRSVDTSQIGYTPPTTLSAGDSDDESTIDLEQYATIHRKGFPIVESTPYLERGRKCASASPAPRDRCQARPGMGNFRSPDGDGDRRTPTVPHLGHHLIEPFGIAPVDLEAQSITNRDAIPDTESLRGIVRSFFAAEKNLNSVSPTIADRQTPDSLTSKAFRRQATFWNPEMIFDFYAKGAITPQKAKETAKRHGLLDVIPIIEQAEELKAGRPSPLQSETPESQVDMTHENFMKKLSDTIAEDELTGTARPLHIFVDMSNIFIGFCNSYKVSQNIPIHQYIRAPAFNIKVLTSIMQRNRTASKKILAGSVAITASDPACWPRYFVDAQAQGYDMKIMNRVQKISPNKSGRRRKSPPQVADMPTSGDESTEDQIVTSFVTRNGEQGVDEILHLNMMNSILDCIEEPATMILATGDAAQAEFSEGFLEYATRALEKGWNLELVTWKKTISSAWMNPAFRKQYGRRFRIIYLDDFLDELNADLRL